MARPPLARVPLAPAPLPRPLDPLPLEELPPLPPLPLAVVGHVEVVSFLGVDRLPRSGEIVHGSACGDHAAGGGAVVAVQLARLMGRPVSFFTALGRDARGEQAAADLAALGLDLHVAWRDAPTRRGIVFVEGTGERAITVIGSRLTPAAADPLPWPSLERQAGVFVTAADAGALRAARRAPLLAATPRVGLDTLRESGVRLDVLIGSGEDPAERCGPGDVEPTPGLTIATRGERGGDLRPGGRFRALARTAPVVDAYGAGDCFAAGVTAAMAAGWPTQAAISLGCHCAMACLDVAGPYAGQLGRERLGRTGRP